ncbi:MAG: polyphosphate polymerase domain-containing protein [Chloroflexi bacterium]|nr:polyphosphate polymerase domain-containing protein [Chloroflexota bacterium]
MCDVSSIIRSFNRFELKYLLSLEAARAFRKEITTYLQPDSHANGDGFYTVSSLYYDSADYRCYWEKLEGLKFRRKLRIRHYETQAVLTPDSPVFVEVKQRLNRVTQKRRVVMAYREALALCDERALPNEAAAGSLAEQPLNRAVVEEIHAMLWQQDLRPASVISYFRQAFVGTDHDLGLRVTFDTHLRYRVHDLTLHAKGIDRFMLPPDRVIMEVKVNERVPYWLTELVAAHNFRLIRVSKYCQSLEAAQRVPRSRYHIV